MKRKTAMFKTAAAAMFIVSATFVGMGASNAYPTPSDETTSSIVNEDEDGWSCVTMGNRVCSPTNDEGVEAGCYNDNAELVATWPCFVTVDDDGNADMYKVGNITRMWGE